MTEENINQELRLKKLDQIRKYLIEEIKQNEYWKRSIKEIVEFWIILNTRLLQFLQLLDVCPCSLVGISIRITNSAMFCSNSASSAAIKK